MRFTILIICALAFLVSCKEQTKSSIQEKKNETLFDRDTITLLGHKQGIMNDVRHSDSAVVMFYKTPGNPRFFTFCKIKNSSTLVSIVDDINRTFIDSMKGCNTNGKIYFYGKGDIVYPIYFTNDKSCFGFSFIKTGEKYFTTMGVESKKILDSLKSKAKEL
jgi:hypothetical protein